jgi:hypothetical protein
MKFSNPLSTAQQQPFGKVDRRRFQRVKLNILGRYMLEDRREFPCQAINMSPGGVALVAPAVGAQNERVVAYLDYIGRVEGRLIRPIDGGFAMTVEATARKREKLAAQLTWLANRHVLNLAEDRRHERFTPMNPFSELTLPDGSRRRCRIIDVSLSGAAIAMIDRPTIGTPVVLGNVRARVVRHFDEGIAVEFTIVHTPDSISEHFDRRAP